MRIGVGFNEDVPVDAQRQVARDVEAAGVDSLWASDNRGRDPLLVCQLRADATERLLVGTAVVQVLTRTPVQLARAAATVQEASGGRLLLGLGVSDPVLMDRWHGTALTRPLSTMRDTLRILDAIACGEATDYDGQVLRSHDFRLEISPPPARVPIYIGAKRPRMLALAGGQADGLMMSWETPESIAAAAAVVRESATAAARPVPELGVSIRVAVARDRGAARGALAGQVATHWERYAGDWASHSQLRAPVEAANEAFERGGRTALAAALGDDILFSLGWYGTPSDDLSDWLAAYAAAGVDHFVARVVGVGDDPVASLHAVLGVLT